MSHELFPDEAEVAAAAPGIKKAEVVERLLLVAGLILFAVLVHRAGLAAVTENLALIGWGFVPIIGQEALAWVFNSLGWHYAIPPAARKVPFPRLMAARMAGDGINAITPTATIGGEFVRARMLEGDMDSASLWASVAVAKISQSVAQAAYIVLGLLVVLPGTSLPDGAKGGLIGGVAVFAALIGLTVVLQRRGIFTTLVRFARRLRIDISEDFAGKLTALDDEVRTIYDAPGAFVASTFFFVLGWVMGAIEIYLILHYLQIGADWHRALTIDVLAAAIDGILFFVPAKAGTQEGGKVVIFTLLGIPDAEVKGFSLGLARRIRDLFWSGVGLCFMLRQQWARAKRTG